MFIEVHTDGTVLDHAKAMISIASIAFFYPRDDGKTVIEFDSVGRLERRSVVVEESYNEVKQLIKAK